MNIAIEKTWRIAAYAIIIGYWHLANAARVWGTCNSYVNKMEAWEFNKWPMSNKLLNLTT